MLKSPSSGDDRIFYKSKAKKKTKIKKIIHTSYEQKKRNKLHPNIPSSDVDTTTIEWVERGVAMQGEADGGEEGSVDRWQSNGLCGGGSTSRRMRRRKP